MNILLLFIRFLKWHPNNVEPIQHQNKDYLNFLSGPSHYYKFDTYGDMLVDIKLGDHNTIKQVAFQTEFGVFLFGKAFPLGEENKTWDST